MEWLNLGSLQIPQGQRVSPVAPAECHCTGASEASMGPGDRTVHLAVVEDEEVGEEEEEGAAEEKRDSWVRRS